MHVQWAQVWDELQEGLRRQTSCPEHPGFRCLRTIGQQVINDIVNVGDAGVIVRSHRTGKDRQIPAGDFRNWWDHLQRDGVLHKSVTGHGSIIRTIFVDCLPERIIHEGGKRLRLIDVGQSGNPRPPGAPSSHLDSSGPGSAIADENEEYCEGRKLLRLHRLRERKRKLVARKKQLVLGATGRLVCEACGFDFAAAYGELGQGFAECHHTLPFAHAAGERRSKLCDLAVVCANCHRMLHRQPWHTVAELRTLLSSQSGGRRAQACAGSAQGLV